MILLQNLQNTTRQYALPTFWCTGGPSAFPEANAS
jgi:hypothetical protein